ncbi:UNVERIFIED_CONTAM: hypothetical protein HDU68_010412 [Siphonaria sp. JEL0065]|nr:hypothetical protein HDU68_010412 [Siphonaria sp. JEL0065]
MSHHALYEFLFLKLADLCTDILSHPFVDSVFGSIVIGSSVLVVVLSSVTYLLSLPPAPPPLEGNILLLHIAPRPDKTLGIASLSPESLALETYLRMSKTPYNTHIAPLVPSKGTPPTLLSYNDKKFTNLHSAIAYSSTKNVSKINLNASLDPVELGAIHAYHCLLDQLSQTLKYLRFTHALNATHLTHQLYKHSNLSIPQTMIQRRKTRQRALETLESSHLLHEPRQQILDLLHTRLCALESLLNGDDFFMGTQGPTVLDAVAFGVLANYILVPMPGCDEGVVWVQGDLQFVQFVRRVSENWFTEFGGGQSSGEEDVVVDGVHINWWGGSSGGGGGKKRKGFDWDAVEQRAVDLWNLSHLSHNGDDVDGAEDNVGNEGSNENQEYTQTQGQEELDDDDDYEPDKYSNQSKTLEEPYKDLVESILEKQSSRTIIPIKTADPASVPALNLNLKSNADCSMHDIAHGAEV